MFDSVAKYAKKLQKLREQLSMARANLEDPEEIKFNACAVINRFNNALSGHEDQVERLAADLADAENSTPAGDSVEDIAVRNLTGKLAADARHLLDYYHDAFLNFIVKRALADIDKLRAPNPQPPVEPAPVDSPPTDKPAPVSATNANVDTSVSDAVERFNLDAHWVLNKAYSGVDDYRRIRNWLTVDMPKYLDAAGRPADLEDTFRRCVEHFNRKAANYNKSHKGANLEPVPTTCVTNAAAQKAIAAALDGKFNGLTLNPLAKNLVAFIADQLSRLGDNVSCTTINTAGRINCDEYSGAIIVNAGTNVCVKLTFTDDSDELTQAFIDKYWGKPAAVTKDLWKSGGAGFDTVKKFFTKAAQYLGLIKIPPAPTADRPLQFHEYLRGQLTGGQELDLFNQDYDARHAVTNFTQRTFGYRDMPGYEDCDPATLTKDDEKKLQAARAEFFKQFTPQQNHVYFKNWQDAFDFIQAFAPANYRFKDAANCALLFAADSGFGFVVNVKAIDAIAAEQLISANRISAITFGRISDNKLQLDSDADKIISFHIGSGKNPSPAELQNWLGLPAASKNSAARFGKPVEVYRFKGGDKIFTGSSNFKFDKAHCPKAGDQLILECGNTNVHFLIAEIGADGVAVRFFDSALVNPNDGVPAYGFEHLDADFTDSGEIKTIIFEGFALKGKHQITKITLVPRIYGNVSTLSVKPAAKAPADGGNWFNGDTGAQPADLLAEINSAIASFSDDITQI